MIWQQLRDLFSLEPELVFYDITSTYFEGRGPTELGRFGYSRDGKPRHRQVLVGVVMMDGWPMAHHVLAGNRLDQTTVAEVVADLGARFGLQRVVWVGDRGVVTLKNLEQLRQAAQRLERHCIDFLLGDVTRFLALAKPLPLSP